MILTPDGMPCHEAIGTHDHKVKTEKKNTGAFIPPPPFVLKKILLPSNEIFMFLNLIGKT